MECIFSTLSPVPLPRPPLYCRVHRDLRRRRLDTNVAVNLASQTGHLLAQLSHPRTQLGVLLTQGSEVGVVRLEPGVRLLEQNPLRLVDFARCYRYKTPR
jgi:hypothetical protein